MTSVRNKICFVSVDVEQDVGTKGEKKFRGIGEMDALLEIFAKYQVPATLFVTGEVLQKYGEQAKLWSQAHEISSHSYSHIFFNELSDPEKESDIQRFVALYEGIFGNAPRGFRAPSHVIDEATVKILGKYGFLYDSSVVPHYPPCKKYRGYLGKAPKTPYYPSADNTRQRGVRGSKGKVLEIPVAGQLLGIPLAGAWIRRLPVAMYRGLFMLYKPGFISLSMHSWDGLEDKGFYGKLADVVLILKRAGYTFQSGGQIADDYFQKN